MLPHFFRGKDDALLAGDKADSRNKKFTGDDKGDKPDGKEARAEQADKGDGNEEFVGEGIEETSKVRFDFPAAGEVAVEPIGQGGGDKEDESEPSGPRWNGWAGTGLEQDEQDEGGDDSGDG